MRSSLAAEIEKRQQSLAEMVVANIYERHTEDWQRYGSEGYQYSLRDMKWNLCFLAQALEMDDPKLFEEYLVWLKGLFHGLGFQKGSLTKIFLVTKDVIKEQLGCEVGEFVAGFIERALLRVETSPDEVGSYISEGGVFEPLAKQYLAALLAGDRNKALSLIKSAVDSGYDLRDIYLEVFQRVQHEVGRLWQLRMISVAQEHFCTSATQVIMAQFYPSIFASSPRKGYRMMGCSVGGELHEMGIRMVSDFFEMEGWETVYLGANTPRMDIIDAVRRFQPSLLCISATLGLHLSEVRNLIQAVKNEVGSKIKVMVGGYPFNISTDLWQRLAADGYAPDARSAVKLAEEMVQL